MRPSIKHIIWGAAMRVIILRYSDGTIPTSIYRILQASKFDT